MLTIGTRGSKLALWQSQQLESFLSNQQVPHQVEIIHTYGDQNQAQPVYAYGIQGVFTKSLDLALINGKIDVAVHSLKDVPTQLAEGLLLAAVLERGPSGDVLIPAQNKVGKPLIELTKIATGSLRRKAQWLNRYPNTQFENLRGNIQTRLKKLEAHDWDGIIMAKAALVRLGLENKIPFVDLDWMLSAPAQGAIGLACREDDKEVIGILSRLNHEASYIATKLERDFLRRLNAGCSAPVAAHAQFLGDEIQFLGKILSLDGQEMVESESIHGLGNWENIGNDCGEDLLTKGGRNLLNEIAHGNLH